MLAIGGAAAWHYARLELTLAHWDARAHLVVARRILDSLTPGWQQIGAVWLPLPHVLTAVPLQVDAWYRTGLPAVVMSVAAVSAGAWAMASIVVRTTGSVSGAAAAAALFILNPNVLYLQSTPMTEPLLFGTSMLAVELVARWVDRGATMPPRIAGWALIAACMTRYEAWPITAALLGLAFLALCGGGLPAGVAATRVARLAAYPLAAILVFMANSRWTVGAWFVSSGFYVPDNPALGHPLLAWQQVSHGAERLSGSVLVWATYLATALVIVTAAKRRTRLTLLLVLALLAAAAVPWYAYVQGHPVRIRYSLPLVVASAAIVGAGVGLLHSRLRVAAAVALVAATVFQARPFDPQAPMVIEAQRDAVTRQVRQAVTDYLATHHDGRTILMSMSSLAHYMHDLSHAGFGIHDFLHEGNGEIWTYATRRPRGHVGWIAIEDRRDGRDALQHAARENPEFLEGFTKVVEAGGIAVYRDQSADGCSGVPKGC